MNFLEIIKAYSNNQDLGEYLRNEYANDLNADPKILEIIKEVPNNIELGARFRKLVLNS